MRNSPLQLRPAPRTTPPWTEPDQTATREALSKYGATKVRAAAQAVVGETEDYGYNGALIISKRGDNKARPLAADDGMTPGPAADWKQAVETFTSGDAADEAAAVTVYSYSFYAPHQGGFEGDLALGVQQTRLVVGDGPGSHGHISSTPPPSNGSSGSPTFTATATAHGASSTSTASRPPGLRRPTRGCSRAKPTRRWSSTRTDADVRTSADIR